MAYILLLLMSSSFAGCESSKGAKIDYPVVGPPPPRFSQNDVAYDDREYAMTKSASGSDIVPAASTSETGIAPGLDVDTEVVAVVNGRAIIAGEILEPYSPQLKVAKTKMSAEQYAEGRKQLIEKELGTYIERIVLLQKLNETMKKEQLKALNEQVDKVFVQHSQEMMVNVKVSNTQELDSLMRTQGTSLQQVKSAFGNQQLALFYMQSVVDKPRIVGRPEMLKYYEEHISEYKKPGKVRWQEISVSFKQHGSEYSAAQHLKLAIDELKNNVPFDDVAKKYSDGATATDGGNWDWTQRESLSDQAISNLLFTLPVGKVSDVYQGESSFKIVKILEREEERTAPFGEKQEDIRNKILSAERQEKIQELLARLKAEANIQTKYQVLQNDKK
jgi:peptidyl-prolyl cis-trans isomerase SurA